MPYYLTIQEYVSVREVVVRDDSPLAAKNLHGEIVDEHEFDFYWMDSRPQVEDVTGDYE